MKRMGWVVLAVVAVLFVSCSKEGAQGPAGPQGTAGATGAAGVPRKIYIGKFQESGGPVTGQQYWSRQVTLPWTPASNGVFVNYRGFSTTGYGGFTDIYDVVVSGATVTVYGTVYDHMYYNYSYYVHYDIVAYDAMTTFVVNDYTKPNAMQGNKVTSSTPLK